MLRGRRFECEVLDQMAEGVRAGTSQALLIRGEPGVGKTALLGYMIEQASGCQVAQVVGAQSEMELAFAGLHQLCAPVLDRLDRLPGPQRDALATVFGLGDGGTPDRFLVGLAVLGLLAEVSGERPLVCVVDDTQWLDAASVQVLAFVARRLVAESVVLVFAVREPVDSEDLTGLPELVVRGLPDEDARELLSGVLRGPVDERVRERVIAEARGNPLALLELPKGMTAPELASGLSPVVDAGISTRIEESYLRQLAPLRADSRRLMLVAAAEPLGDPVVLWRAAELLGIGVEASEQAARAGLLEIGAGVRFRHPLLRSAIYRAALPSELRAVHQALAEVIDPETDPDRRAWHRALALSSPDEEVAADLETSAGRAQARGGLTASAAFLQRAAELSLDPARRAGRALAAAQAHHDAGAPESALRLLSVARTGPPDELQAARVDLLRAQIAFTVDRGRDAPPLLLRAARQLEPLDIRLARDTYLDALSSALFANEVTTSDGARGLAAAARAAPRPPGPPRVADLLLDGIALQYTEGSTAGMPILREALRAFRDPALPEREGLRWLWLACRIAANLWDDETLDVLTARHVQLVREAGALAMLPLALNQRIGVRTLTGELGDAEVLRQELDAVLGAVRVRIAPYGALLLAAWRGREAETLELIDRAFDAARSRGEGVALSFVTWAQALLYSSLGRYDEVLAVAANAGRYPRTAMVELIEAAARRGDDDVAAGALRRLSTATRASGTDWALGVEALSRAMLSTADVAESAYREAIGRLELTLVRSELARAHLLYGEWLRRRAGRRIDAREQLRTAHAMFSGMGMEAFTQRAARELLAAGEPAGRRRVETSAGLTAQEAQIASLAGEGLTNPEIGVRLFLSHRTVEWHMGKIFGKLGVTSRRELRRRRRPDVPPAV